MDKEYNKLIELFSLEAEEKEKRLDEIFHLSMEFIEKYQHIKDEGNEEEREEMTKKLSVLRDKICQEARTSESALNISKEEVKELSASEKNFSKEQWELMQKTKNILQSEKKKLQEYKQTAIKNTVSKASSKTPGKKKTKRKRSSWLKS